MGIVERIYALKESANISAKDLAEASGVSAATLSQWKKGLQKPSTDAVIKIADYFGVSTDYLLKGEVPHERKKNESNGLSMKTAKVKRRVEFDVVKNGLIALFNFKLSNKMPYDDAMGRLGARLKSSLCEMFSNDISEERIREFVALTLNFNDGYTGDTSDFPNYSEFKKMMSHKPHCKEDAAIELLSDLNDELEIMKAEKDEELVFGEATSS
ncbi:MAG: helix-turn-helix domain-containing protein [Defluviitaleaceae bacterium]|nr:helix-turn-helix domain-containing protein [Defluviitaleaceae bacterium]